MRAVRSAILAAAVILATVMSGVVILPTVSAAQSLKDAVKLHEDADKLRDQGCYAEAEPLYKRALAIYEQSLDNGRYIKKDEVRMRSHRNCCEFDELSK
jgi:hypothetical protein